MQNCEYSAKAESTLSVEGGNAELFLPTSYEQYLNLSAPSDIAFSENHIAIADGKVLYVYDRANGKYISFDHQDFNIANLGFSENGTLYYSDKNGSLFTFNPQTQTKSSVTLSSSSSSFYLVGNTFYNVFISTPTITITSYAIDGNGAINPSTANRIDSFDSLRQPVLTYCDETLFCAVDTVHAHKSGVPSEYFLFSSTHNEEVSSMCALGNALYYTTANGLYRYERSANGWANGNNQLLSNANISALTVYNGQLYCTQGDSIRQISISDNTAYFTDYEICASSDSLNRLGNGTQTARAGDLLVTSDAQNNRISVYNLKNNGYTVHAINSPELVATDGEVIAVSTQNKITLFGAKNTDFTVDGKVTGLACLFGKTYYTTENGEYGVFDGTQKQTANRGNLPKELTCDLYGNLYAIIGNQAVKFTEGNFLKSAEGGEVLFALDANAHALRADFKGNLYYLVGKEFYQNGTKITAVSAKNAVFRTDSDTVAPLSFALGFEDKSVYFLYDNFALTTTALDFAVLNEIDKADITAQVFAPQSGLNLVDVREGAVGIKTDLTALKTSGGNYFPYAGYARVSARRGILLGTAGEYSLVALFCDGGGYQTRLFRTDSCTAVNPTEYSKVQNVTRYLTSNVSPTYFPCLEQSLQAAPLARAQKVTLLSTVSTGNAAEYEYGYIEYQTETGVKRGYVPLTYLTAVSPLPASENFRVAYLAASEEGVLFTAEDGTTVLVKERTQVTVSGEGESLIATIKIEGKTYVATVTPAQLEEVHSDALRISLIVILSVLAAIIVGVYIFLVLGKKKNKR